MSENNLPLVHRKALAVHKMFFEHFNYCVYNNNNKSVDIYADVNSAVKLRDLMINENVVDEHDIVIVKVCKHMKENKQKDICSKKALELLNSL